MDELLDTLEFCEGALLDYVASEDGLEIEAARRILGMCSDQLIKHNRTSIWAEKGKGKGQ
jgi:hypothetical protein